MRKLKLLKEYILDLMIFISEKIKDFMSSAETIFSIQADLIREASLLFEDRINRIEELGNSLDASSRHEAEKKKPILVFQARSLKVVKDILVFLAEEIVRKDVGPHHYYFLLPHVRTLFDIHARSLHLLINCPDDNKKALTCIGYQLLTYKKIVDEYYRKTLPVYKAFLEQEGFTFPENSSEFDGEWLRKKCLVFGGKERLLTAENIKKYSTYSFGVFPAKKPYEIYSYLAEFSHGNPYYNRDPYTERFWVVRATLDTSAFLIELIDKTVLNRGLQRDFKIWLNKVEGSIKELTDFWANERRIRHE